MSLSDRIYNKFEEWSADISKGLGGFIGKVIAYGMEGFQHRMGIAFKPIVLPMLREWQKDPDCPPYLKAVLDRWITEDGEWQASLAMSMGGSAASGAASSSMGSGLEWLKQASFRKLPINLYPLDSAIRLYLRDELTEEALRAELLSYGFNPEHQAGIMELAKAMPSVGDVITWAAREVFEPELRAKFRLDEGLPPDFLEWAAKVGITGEVAKNYWAAHWYLPSMTQVYEMWHRAVIAEDDVDAFFVEQDMCPYWRDNLKAISFIPFTRVDVRRMYKFGVLDEAGVTRAYKDLGFDEEKAQVMTDFTVKYYARPEDAVEEEEEKIRELTRADVCDGYRRAILTDAECTELLGKLAYEAESVQFYLDREDLKRDQALKDAYAANYRRLYVIGIKDDAAAKTEMVDLGFLDTEVDELLKLWYIEKIRREAKPSRTDLTGFLKNGTISEDRWRAEMASLGYADEYIELYFRDREERPSRADLTRFLKKEIITEDRWRAEMAALGYADECIGWYLEDTKA